MKIKIILAATLLLVTGQVHGHGFDLEGGEGSVAELFTTALAQAAMDNPSITVEPLACKGSCYQVQNEDYFGYLECTELIKEATISYQCFAAEKHGRALRAKEDYRRGDYMNFEGGGKSNATYLFAQLNRFAESHAGERLSVRDINENRRVVEWKTESETFTCTQDTGSGEPQTKCRIQR